MNTSHPLSEEQFFQLAKNRNTYKVIKQLDGDLSYAKIGDRYMSDTLFDRGYNILQLVKDSYLELVPRIFPFEKDVVGKNVQLQLLNEIEKWTDTYEFSFQFWGEGQNNVFISKDDVEIASFGGADNIQIILRDAVNYIHKINRVTHAKQ